MIFSGDFYSKLKHSVDSSKSFFYLGLLSTWHFMGLLTAMKDWQIQTCIHA